MIRRDGELAVRISRKQFDWDENAAEWTLVKESAYLYDEWNCVGVLDGTDALTEAYVWGTDLSATVEGSPTGPSQGAGGVGGLLAAWLLNGNGGLTSAFYTFDGNGNVTGLTGSSSGLALANYDYTPFGQTSGRSGVLAETNTLRFSTKPEDAELELVYYGFRFYSSLTGQWKSRDPMEEEGGVNLFAGAGNNFINYTDMLGMDYHHWYTTQSEAGVGNLCKKFIIDRYTTFIGGITPVGALYDNTPHGWLHHKWRYHIKYAALVKYVTSASFIPAERKCCALMAGTTVFMIRSWRALRKMLDQGQFSVHPELTDKFEFTGTRPHIKLETYTKNIPGPRVDTTVEHMNRLSAECHCSFRPTGKYIPIPRDGYGLSQKDREILVRVVKEAVRLTPLPPRYPHQIYPVKPFPPLYTPPSSDSSEN